MTPWSIYARWTLAASVSAMLGACGGGGSGLNSTPAPIPRPTPSAVTGPTPTPTPPSTVLPAGPLGLRSDAPFPVLAVSRHVDLNANGEVVGGTESGPANSPVAIAYSAAADRYTISIPGFEIGQLVNSRIGSGDYYNEAGQYHSVYSSLSDVSRGSASEIQPVTVGLTWPANSSYSYTSFGSWNGRRVIDGADSLEQGIFVYGIPTASGDVPVVGTASYYGGVSGADVSGLVHMAFDFANGTLSGSLNLDANNGPFGPYPLTTLTFRDTVYASGRPFFSGGFAQNGEALSGGFSGVFTGPGAAEAMASFTTAIHYNPNDSSLTTIDGVWIAKK